MNQPLFFHLAARLVLATVVLLLVSCGSNPVPESQQLPAEAGRAEPAAADPLATAAARPQLLSSRPKPQP